MIQESIKNSIFLNEHTDDPLAVINSKALQAQNAEVPNYDFETPLWDEKMYHLHGAKIYNDLPEKIQIQVLMDLSQSLLSEAYYIEQAGMSFGAKMSQNSRTLNERIFYSLMSAEEAVHFALLKPYMDTSQFQLEGHSFAHFIGTLIIEGEFQSLNVLIQVVLEGWGLSHYKDLRSYCLNHELQDILKRIILDEARHHGCGVKLAQVNELSKNQEKFILNALKELLFMVRIGPQSLVSVLAKYSNLKDKGQRELLLEQIRASSVTQEKLDRLKKIIKPVVSNEILNELSTKDFFKSYSLKEMANIFCN